MTDSDQNSKPDLEHDLLASDRIRAKAQNPVYAQHLYAALCNNQYQRRELWPVLSGHTWGCSWRYAGSVVAQLQGNGSYIDWYCSGMGRRVMDADAEASVFDQSWAESDQSTEEYQEMQQYVGEGTVTAEIAADLASLNWHWVPFDPAED
jgi:hypothetical protein